MFTGKGSIQLLRSSTRRCRVPDLSSTQPVEHGGFEPPTPCLPGKTGRAARCRLVSFELEPSRYLPLAVGSVRSNCGKNCGTLRLGLRPDRERPVRTVYPRGTHPFE